MTIGAILERIRGKRSDLQKQRRQTFAELVNALADGETVDDDTIEAMLADAGKTLDDLQSAVETRSQRIELAKQLAEADAKRPLIAAAEREQKRLVAKRETVVAELSAKIREQAEIARTLRFEADSVKAQCERQLLATKPQAIIDRMAQIAEERAPLFQKLTWAIERLSTPGMGTTPALNVLTFERRLASDAPLHAGSRKEFEAKLAAAREEVAEAKRVKAECEAAMNALQTEMESLERRAMEA